MNSTPATKEKNRRILVIDDNRAIHDDFKKILQPEGPANTLSQAEADIFGDAPASKPLNVFTVDSAYQGEEGVVEAEQVGHAAREGDEDHAGGAVGEAHHEGRDSARLRWN